ncbi:MAG: CHAT domain-containing protein [Lewinellaceae bacterium]|nr:CHAT domain-containing protein [Lewinellaceae bacterium]
MAKDITSLADSVFYPTHPYYNYYGALLGGPSLIFIRSGYYREAETTVEKAKEWFEKNIDPKPVEYYVILSHYSLLCRKRGQFLKSLDLSLKAFEGSKDLLGEAHPNYIMSINAVGVLYQEIGDYPKALYYLKKTKELYDKYLGKNHTGYSVVLNNMATNYSYMGFYDKALIYHDQCLVLHPQDHPDFPLFLFNKGLALELQDSLNKAEAIYQEALKKQEELSGKPSAIILSGIGRLYYKQGKLAEAENYFSEAINTIKKEVDGPHELISKSLAGIGLIYTDKKDFGKADSLYKQALEMEKSIYGDTFNLIKVYPIYNNLGKLYRNEGRLPEALEYFRRSNFLLHQELKNNYAVLSTEGKEAYLNSIQPDLDLYCAFAWKYGEKLPEAVDLVYNDALAVKGLAFTSAQHLIEEMRLGSDSTMIPQFVEWQNLKNVIAKQYSLPKNQRQYDADSLFNLAENMEEELSRMSKGFRGALRKITTDTLKNALKADHLAIEFIDFKLKEKDTVDRIIYAALILRKGWKHVRLVPLFDEETLLEKIASATKNGTEKEKIHRLYRGTHPPNAPEHYQTLYELIWQPLEPYLEGVQTIYYSPSGELHRLAMAAIEKPSGQLLSEKYNLIHLASTRDIVGRQPYFADGVTTGVVFGNMAYDCPLDTAFYRDDDYAYHDKGNYNWGRVKPLNDTLEIRLVYDRFTSYGIKTEMYQGMETDESGFKNLGKLPYSPELLHISTHGLFLSKRDIESEKAKKVSHFFEHPLYRSLLFLGCVNNFLTDTAQVNQYEENEGLLVAFEAANLNLSNTRLINLSACESGLGIINGEGVQGLQRAFLLAGSDYVMMTLWQVPVEPTAEFMDKFYQYWLQKKVDIREAFLKTQAEMREKYPQNAYAWAAFVLVGK